MAMVAVKEGQIICFLNFNFHVNSTMMNAITSLSFSQLQLSIRFIIVVVVVLHVLRMFALS